MKLVVPLTMPITRWIRSPVSDSRRARTRGMAPATAASYSRSTPRFLARVRRATPFGRGQQRLVGGDHRLPGLERRPDQLAGRLEPADELDHHVDGRVRHQTGGVGGEQLGGDVRSAGPARVVDGDARRSRGGPRSGRPAPCGRSCSDADQGGPDVAASEHGRPGRCVRRRAPRSPESRYRLVRTSGRRIRGPGAPGRRASPAGPPPGRRRRRTKTTAGRGTLL